MATDKEADEKRQEEERRYRQWLTTPATASWKITQEEFRRGFRSGEFAPEAKPAETKPVADEA